MRELWNHTRHYPNNTNLNVVFVRIQTFASVRLTVLFVYFGLLPLFLFEQQQHPKNTQIHTESIHHDRNSERERERERITTAPALRTRLTAWLVQRLRQNLIGTNQLQPRQFCKEQQQTQNTKLSMKFKENHCRQARCIWPGSMCKTKASEQQKKKVINIDKGRNDSCTDLIVNTGYALSLSLLRARARTLAQNVFTQINHLRNG